MKKLLFALILLFLFQSCVNNYKKTASLSEFIPDNSLAIIKINDLETFKADVSNNDLVSNIVSNAKLDQKLNYLNQLNVINTIFLCFDNESEDFSVLTKLNDSLIKNTDSLTLKYKIVDSVFVGSNSEAILNSIKRRSNKDFEKINNTSNDLKSFTLFLKNEATKHFSDVLIKNNDLQFSNWVSLDMEVSPERIKIDGIGINNDTLIKSTQLFNNSIPQENSLKRIIPKDVQLGKIYTYDDFQNLKANLNEINKITSDSIFSFELFETFNEIGEIKFNNETVVIARSIDAAATNEALRSYQNEIEVYRNVAIKTFESPSFFKKLLEPLISTNSISKYIHLDDFFVFSESTKALQSIISNFQNNTTLANDYNFTENEISLSDESSFITLTNYVGHKHLISTLFKGQPEISDTNNFNSSTFQLIQDDGFIHINGIISKGSKRTCLLYTSDAADEHRDVVLWGVGG